MKGKVINIPKEYVGVVFHESCPPINKNDDRKFFQVHTFKSLTHWNWSKEPTSNDTIIKALDWIDVAEAVSINVKYAK